MLGDIRSFEVYLPWQDVGDTLRAIFEGLTLAEGQPVWAKVRAVDGAGNQGLPALSDGWIPDLLTEGLVARWTFNPEDVSQDVLLLDTSGNGLHGAILGGPVAGESPLVGAYQFDGVDDCIQIQDSVNLQLVTVTVVAWVRYDAAGGFPGRRVIVEHANGTSNGYAMSKSVDGDWWNWRWQAGTSGTIQIEVGSSRPFTPGQWSHLAFLFDEFNTDGPTAIGFVDGIQDSTTVGDLTLPVPAPGPTTIGCADPSGVSEAAPASIDEVRIYNRALTGDEVNRLRQMGQMSSR
jgi:hypothetical protein